MSMRVRVEYYDQNDSFARCLPARGTLVRALTTTGYSEPWWIMKLDVPIDYQDDRLLPAGVRSEELVISTRWRGHQVGDAEPTAVHILLPLDAASTQGTELEISKFLPVAWGMCHTEPALNPTGFQPAG